jgi:hypothetical protein
MSTTPPGQPILLEEPQAGDSSKGRAHGTAVVLLASTLAACRPDAAQAPRAVRSNGPTASASTSPSPHAAVKHQAPGPGAKPSATLPGLTPEACEQLRALGGYGAYDTACPTLSKVDAH